MTDNEQELLQPIEVIGELNDYIDKYGVWVRHYKEDKFWNWNEEIILKAQVTKLKAMGYEQVWIKCPDCDGKGSWVEKDDACNAVGDPCDKCDGTGKIYKYVKWDREKVAKDLYGKARHSSNLLYELLHRYNPEPDDRYELWTTKWGEWNKLNDTLKKFYRIQADQLKEILEGT